jgi:hypothetical protein
MNTQAMVEKDFLHALFQKCIEEATGTFFLVTNYNRSIQLVIKQGKLTQYSHGREKGLSALANLKNSGIQSFSFSDDKIIPLGAGAEIKNSGEALEFLGFKEYQDEVSKGKIKPENQEAVDKKEQRNGKDRRIIGMYRGQPVYAEIKDAKPIIERRKGERRVTGMYRGQPLYAKD